MDPHEHDEVATALAALAYPARLDILEQLHDPRILSDIRIRARRGDADEGGGRVASKQTVLAHLEKLVEAGFVTTAEVESQGRRLTSYAVDPQRVYAIVEALRDVSARHAGRGRSADETGTLRDAPTAREASGPRVVLVHGLYDGHAFPLAGEGPWTLGRARTAEVSLDYDPYVSAEHARIDRGAFGFALRDDGASKNGTSVNWRTVPPGKPRALAHGDVIRLGRSTLVFYER